MQQLISRQPTLRPCGGPHTVADNAAADNCGPCAAGELLEPPRRYVRAQSVAGETADIPRCRAVRGGTAGTGRKPVYLLSVLNIKTAFTLALLFCLKELSTREVPSDFFALRLI